MSEDSFSPQYICDVQTCSAEVGEPEVWFEEARLYVGEAFLSVGYTSVCPSGLVIIPFIW